MIHFERRLIAERTRNRIRPKDLDDADMTHEDAAHHLGIGQSMAYSIASKLQTT